MNRFLLLLLLLNTILLEGASASSWIQNANIVKVKGKVIHPVSDSIRLGTKSTALDTKGNFQFQVPLVRPAYITLQSKGTSVTLFAEPGIDMAVTFEEGNVEKTIQFKGGNKEVNRFLFDQKAVSERFNRYFNKYANSYLYRLPEPGFIHKMDSLQATFLEPLNVLAKKNRSLSKAFLKEYETVVALNFLSFLADYPLIHVKNTGQPAMLSESSRRKLAGIDFNDPALHQYDGFKGLLRNDLYLRINQELEKKDYASSDNKRLDAGFAVIKDAFTNQQVFDKVLFDFLLSHIEDLGIKHIESNLAFFNKHVQNLSYKEEIDKLYKTDLAGRRGHLIRTYKEVKGHALDAHIFMPDSLVREKKYPTIAMFHGGSFDKGKPDWFFSSCEAYARQGWVAVAVEYRVAQRHGNLLPEAISDGKSLMRFLREHASELGIDTARIMVAGNSAGAGIALAMATLDTKLDEQEENLAISSRPNAIMINAAPADLTETGNHWWHKHYSQEFIQSISPMHQVRSGLPPMLVVHGTEDNAVAIAPVRSFVKKAQELGNPIYFHELQGAPHIIWQIPYFARQITKFQQDFIKELKWK